jgi:hypothetical protein
VNGCGVNVEGLLASTVSIVDSIWWMKVSKLEKMIWIFLLVGLERTLKVIGNLLEGKIEFEFYYNYFSFDKFKSYL